MKKLFLSCFAILVIFSLFAVYLQGAVIDINSFSTLLGANSPGQGGNTHRLIVNLASGGTRLVVGTGAGNQQNFSIDFNGYTLDFSSANANATTPGGAYYFAGTALPPTSMPPPSGNTGNGYIEWFSSAATGTMNFTNNVSLSSGGAAFFNGGYTHISNLNVNFTNNISSRAGGAIYLAGTIITQGSNTGIPGYLDFDDNNILTFTGNRAQSPTLNVYGGAVYLDRGTTFNSNAVTTFQNNIASATAAGISAYGGAIYVSSAAVANFTNNTTFTGNTAFASVMPSYGGAIYNAGALNLTPVLGTSITFANNSASFGRDVWNTASATMTISGAGHVYFGSGVEGYGRINKTGTGNVYFQATSYNKIDSTMTISAGGMYLSTSIYVQTLNLANNTTLGIDVVFSDPLNNPTPITPGTSFIWAPTMSVGTNVMLDLNVIGFEFAGSSVAVMFTNSDMTSSLFANANSIQGAKYLYDFVWVNDNQFGYNWTGWLIWQYPPYPWNTFVLRWEGVAVEDYPPSDVIVLEEDIIARDDVEEIFRDDNPFGSPVYFSSVTVLGSGKTIDSNNLYEKKFLLNNGQEAIFSSVTLRNFASAQYGGAMLLGPGGKVSFVDEVNFINNKAARGGAIAITDSSTASFNNRTVFSGNVSYDNGGTSTNTAMGGAVYVSSSVITVTGTVDFTQNIASAAAVGAYGGAIFIGSNSVLNVNGGGAINFTNNAARGAESYGGAIYNSGEINITAGNASFVNNNSNGTIGAGGAIYNAAGSTISFINANVSFINNVAMSSGGAIYNAGTFNIEDSTLTFSGNQANGQANDFYQTAEGIMNIMGSADVNMDGVVQGEGLINKSATGLLSLNRNHSLYTGYFNQTAGTTTVTSAGRMFAGTNTISNSVLNITASDIYYTVNLSTAGMLRHWDENITSSTTVNGNLIRFTANGATAYFGLAPEAAAPNIYAYYNLDGKIDNGQSNTVVFDNSYVIFSSTDFVGGSTYEFTNSIIDLVDPVGITTRTIEFTGVNATGSMLRFGIGFEEIGTSSFSLVSDKLISDAGSSGELDIFRTIRLYFGDEFEDLTLNYDYYTKVLYGGLTFQNNISTITIGTASNRRSYQLWVAEDLQGIYVNSDGSSTSLYISNLQEGYRQYLIDVDTYNISGIFTDTSQGTFLVFGNDDVDDDPSSWVISGVIVSTDTNINGTSSYLFTLSSATDFTLQYLTVTSATAITDPASPTRIEWGESGAVILQTNAQSTATIEGVYFTYNTAASSGGAIATYAGQMSISNALFMGNEANAGGAIYSVNEGLIINNSQFEDNIAVSSGGAIYNDAGGSLILGADAESVNFSNNSALSGGAIYNAGSVVLSASEGISINFIDNSALNAVYGHDIYQTSAGTITIDGGGDIVISGGIAGSGTINKTAGNLYLDGDNSGYAGTFNQSAGYTEVTGGYFTGISSITGGILELADGASVGAVTIGIYSGGLLDITTDGDLTFTGNISGNGNINKDLSATGTLTLTGDNSGFNGTFTQNAGTTIVNGGKYFTGISRINAGVLNINAATLVNGGTMGIYGGGQVYFETSAVLDALNMGSGLLGLEVDWNQGGKGLLTLFIETTTTTLTANSRLHVTTVTAAAVKVVGSSTSIMSADYLTNGQSVVFSTNNITGDSLYGMGYRFKWSQDADGWTGWLLTGALPWNTLVSYTINAVSGETIYLAENVTAGLFDTADRNAFATLPVTATNITLAGYNGQTYIIDSGGIQNLGLTLDGSSVTIRDLELRNFVRQAAGGAINNVNGQLTIINSNFVGNYADTSGGAIYNAAGSSVYVEANGGISEIFANNTANSSFGGAIYNAGLVVLNASEGSSITFVNNKALLAGNDIYNVGTINITGLGDIVISSGIAGTGSGTINKTAGNLYLGGNNSGYAGTFNQSAGYTEVTGAYFTGISSITGGVLELADGASLSIGELGIYNGALLEITTGGDLEFSGNITGDGEINKELSSTGMLSLSGDNSGFTGIYRQYAGMTLVSGDYFTGISSITAGVLELADGAVLSTGTIGIYESALLEITTYGDLEFSGNITGDGNINKELSSAGTLTLTGDNSGFTGVFNQYAGTTTVTADGIMFSGINTISDSVLNITSGSVYYSVNLSTNAILNHYGLNTVSTTTIESSTAQTIDNSKINFTGYGAAANFGLDSSVSDADIYAHYNLAEKIDNGQINTVAFDNAYVVFGSTDYSGASIYTFTDSIIDITSAGNSTRTITFDDITATNSKLRFGIGFEEIGTSSFSLVSDKLVSNGAGTGELGILDSIRLYFGDDLSLTTNYDYYTQVLSGGLTFRTDISTITMGSASSAYTYELWVATNNYQSIYVRVLGEGMTLYDANMAVGDRSYLIDVSLYNIDRAFTDTGWGEFLVRGNGDDAGNWVISGEIPGTGSSYLFTLSSATDFTLRNLTVTQASATRSDTSNSGSVILQTSALSTATIENVYFTYNTALSSGGAIATYAGEMTIDSATFAGNTANAGGAIFNGNEQITINNSQFNDNTAVYGGAIYNALSANMSVIASDARQFIFDGNIASSSGGAIYNAGLINFETAAGSSITFINNSAASGSDIYNTGTINITGAGDVVISSGIAGSGTINNLANIYLGGDNSGYAGLFNQTAGYTKVTGNYFTGTSSITAGVLELADGAVLSTGTIGIYDSGLLEITTLGNLTFDGNILGDGTINKEATNTGTLTLNGDNSSFSGMFNQYAGKTVVTGNYFTGISSIAAGEINFNGQAAISGGNIYLGNAGVMNINMDNALSMGTNLVSGTGVINKDNAANLNITGDNSSFRGMFNQYAGKTVVTGNYFTGASNITAGVLELADGAVLSTGTIGIYDSGLLEITTAGNLEFSGNITGNGNITKESSSTGVLTLTGNNSGFSGLYTQNAGTTAVTGTYFTGTSSITAGELALMANAQLLGG
ncbi:MAG: hypothetical protein FWD54_05395, partial [Endomicrobia bacterium]|nr:hypothetical protein [Endomicrobiia bacterium]